MPKKITNKTETKPSVKKTTKASKASKQVVESTPVAETQAAAETADNPKKTSSCRFTNSLN